MLLSSLRRQVLPLANPAMLCAVSARLPFAAAPASRRAVAPITPTSPRLLAGITTRAQSKDQPAKHEPEGGAKSGEIQKASGSDVAAPAARGDLLDFPMMPVPFRRMADNMMQMQREMDSLMGAFGMPSPLAAFSADPFEMLERAAAAPLLARRAGGGALRGPLARVIPLDVEEDDKGYTVTAEVPGFDKNEIKVSLSEDGMLTMTGSHEESTTSDTATTLEATEAGKAAEGKEAVPKARTRRFESFVRSVQLPDDADREGISASTQHGVLAVRIPKTPKPAPKVREIPVA